MNLEEDFTYRTLNLQKDYEGDVKSTLISAKQNSTRKKAVLYLHGFIDYFFHSHVAEQFTNHDIDFYALDLRKYGRSLLPHQHPNYCRDIKEYYEEISLALTLIHEKNQTEITLLGHSTGGLIACNYMMDGEQKGIIKNLVLNSPFLDFFLPKPVKNAGLVLAKFSSKAMQFGKLEGALPPSYPESLHKDFHGEWDFNFNWKPIKGFPTYFKWLIAINKAQKKLKKSNIQIPVLLLHSHQSKKMLKFTEEAHSADIVLNVEHMKEIGPKLGANVTLIEIQNGMHDLFLSKKEVREKAFEEMFMWLTFADKKDC
jgi:alpha-beta hydrolase superfamily lysophospholipase